MKQDQIIKKAHQPNSSELARAHFKDCGLSYSDIQMDNLKKLRQFINAECYKLLADESYSMIKQLEVNVKIKKDKYGFFLTARGSYFEDREAISFYNPETNDKSITIGFCGWADGCNRIPFVVGFIKWCDWMKGVKNEKKSKRN